MDGHLFELAIASISVLGSINAYFISRLIRKIDESAEIVKDFKKELAVLNEKINSLSDVQHRLVILEKQIAVFEYVIKEKKEVL